MAFPLQIFALVAQMQVRHGLLVLLKSYAATLRALVLLCNPELKKKSYAKKPKLILNLEAIFENLPELERKYAKARVLSCSGIGAQWLAQTTTLAI